MLVKEIELITNDSPEKKVTGTGGKFCQVGKNCCQLSAISSRK